jgi:transposase
MLAVIKEPTAEGPRVRPDGTTILFGLPGVRVRDVERVDDGTRLVHVVTDDETAAFCPECGVRSSAVRQRRTTRPRDLPYGEQPLLVRWHKVQYACCAHADIPELERLAATIEAWWPEILGFLFTGVTNAGTEATNRTVKTAARTAYGFRNLDNQRRRVRFACTRQQRRTRTAA